MEEIAVTTATEIARALKTFGVRKVFGLCADQINNIYDALLAADIEIVSCRQESAALHMADGWARASGEPGVALVGGGPGFINSVTGFAVAQSAATLVIVISGQPPLDTRERNGHQDEDRLSAGKSVRRRLSRCSLVRGRDGIFQIDDHSMWAGRMRFRNAVDPICRNKQIAAADMSLHVNIRKRQWPASRNFRRR